LLAMKMNLRHLLDQDKLKRHTTSKEEITNLLSLVKRDLEDAKVKGLSCDRKFATAYNAALQLATILLYCEGYKPKGIGHHFTVFLSMKEILGKNYNDLTDYFDACRAKRNITDYTHAGEIAEKEAEELVKEGKKFLVVIMRWLEKKYPELIE